MKEEQWFTSWYASTVQEGWRNCGLPVGLKAQYSREKGATEFYIAGMLDSIAGNVNQLIC